MSKHYYAVRYIRAPDQLRIEHADTPEQAFRLAFGHPSKVIKSAPPSTEYKDLGTRRSVLQSDKNRISLLTSNEGWIVFK